MSNEWPIQMFHYVPGPSSVIEMMRGALKVVQQCAAVKPGEKVVISTDTNNLRIAEMLAAATVGVGGVPVIVMITPTGAHGAQLPEPATAAVAKSDVFFLPATSSQTHTDARIQANANGSRGCTMLEVTMSCLGGHTVKCEPRNTDGVGRA